jgi:hypothetical protein
MLWLPVSKHEAKVGVTKKCMEILGGENLLIGD